MEGRVVEASWYELCDTCDAMIQAVEACKESGAKAANAEKEYRKALAIEELQLSNAGERATLIPDLARGAEHIADLKCERDCAEVIYKADCELVNVNKLKSRFIDAQLGRDWHAS